MLNKILNKSDELQAKLTEIRYRGYKDGWTTAIQIEADNLQMEVNELESQLDKYIKDNGIKI